MAMSNYARRGQGKVNSMTGKVFPSGNAASTKLSGLARMGGNVGIVINDPNAGNVMRPTGGSMPSPTTPQRTEDTPTSTQVYMEE